MCEFCEEQRKNAAIGYFSSHPESMIARSITKRFPYVFRPNCCPHCGKTLQPWEQRPQGRATRCMCTYDYEMLVPNNVGNYKCIVCGGSLPDHKVRAQHGNPRELSNHIHDGECMHLWTLIHNVSICEPDIIEVFREHQKSFLPSPLNPFLQKPVFPQARSPKALPLPIRQLSYDPEAWVMREKDPIISEYKGKKVRQISAGFSH